MTRQGVKNRARLTAAFQLLDNHPEIRRKLESLPHPQKNIYSYLATATLADYIDYKRHNRGHGDFLRPARIIENIAKELKIPTDTNQSGDNHPH